MAPKRLSSYLRTFRKRSGLTQTEVAFLVGAKSRALISRFEHEHRLPPTETLLLFAIVFRSSAEELLPGVHRKLTRAACKRARELHEQLQGNSRQVTAVKLDALEAVFANTAAHKVHSAL